MFCFFVAVSCFGIVGTVLVFSSSAIVCLVSFLVFVCCWIVGRKSSEDQLMLCVEKHMLCTCLFILLLCFMLSEKKLFACKDVVNVSRSMVGRGRAASFVFFLV